MTLKTIYTAAAAAAISFCFATSSSATVVGGEVIYDETRCSATCADIFADVTSIGSTATTFTAPTSLGVHRVLEGQYLGGDSFGFDVGGVSTPRFGGIIRGIDFLNPSTLITGLTVGFSGVLTNAVLRSAFMDNAIAIFVTADSAASASAISDGRITVDLTLNTPAPAPVPTPPTSGPSTPPANPAPGAAPDPSPVPLPAGFVLILSALGALGFAARRRSA